MYKVWTTQELFTACNQYNAAYSGVYGQHEVICHEIAKTLGRDTESVRNKMGKIRFTAEYRDYVRMGIARGIR